MFPPAVFTDKCFVKFNDKNYLFLKSKKKIIRFLLRVKKFAHPWKKHSPSLKVKWSSSVSGQDSVCLEYTYTFTYHRNCLQTNFLNMCSFHHCSEFLHWHNIACSCHLQKNISHFHYDLIKIRNLLYLY